MHDAQQALDITRDAIRGCFVGVVVGEAIGLPWKGFSHPEIRGLTGGKGVTDLQAVPAGVSRKAFNGKRLPLGEPASAWQLTNATATSLIRCGGFELMDQALAHVRELETSTFGWGPSLIAGISEIRQWLDTRGCEGRPPYEEIQQDQETRGFGSGAITRVAPIACFYDLLADSDPGGWTYDVFHEWVSDLASMTHGEDACRAAIMVAEVIHDAVMHGNAAPKPHDAEWLLHAFRLSQAQHGINFGPEILGSADFLRVAVSLNFRAESIATFAIGTFFRHPTSFREAILEAVNAGGNTSAQASVVGAMVGANIGLTGIRREEWSGYCGVSRDKIKEAVVIADQLVDSVLSLEP